MILTMLPVTVSAAEPFTDTGTCGANVTYAYDSASETLTISGSGQMADYNPNYYAGDDKRSTVVCWYCWCWNKI